MSTEPQSSESGFSLEHIFFSTLRFEGVTTAPAEKSADDEGFLVGWDWQILGERRFEVMFGLSFNPTAERPERVKVVAHGRFLVTNPSTELPVPRFASHHAPAILFPFLREAISSLTSKGAIGPLLLDPLNISAVMGDLDPMRSTAGETLRTTPAVGGDYGISDSEIEESRSRLPSRRE